MDPMDFGSWGARQPIQYASAPQYQISADVLSAYSGGYGAPYSPTLHKAPESMVSQASMVGASSYGYPPPSLAASPEAAAELYQSSRSSMAAQSTARMEAQAAELKYLAQARDAQEAVESFTQQVMTHLVGCMAAVWWC